MWLRVRVTVCDVCDVCVVCCVRVWLCERLCVIVYVLGVRLGVCALVRVPLCG